MKKLVTGILLLILFSNMACKKTKIIVPAYEATKKEKLDENNQDEVFDYFSLKMDLGSYMLKYNRKFNNLLGLREYLIDHSYEMARPESVDVEKLITTVINNLKNNDIGKIRSMISAGLNTNIQIYNYRDKVNDILLKRGANPFIKHFTARHDFTCPYLFACENENVDALNLFYKYGYNSNQLFKDGFLKFQFSKEVERFLESH